MTVRIHPSAIIGPRVRLEATVRIGAYAIVGATEGEEVVIGADSAIGHHSVILGDVAIAERTVLDPFSRVGPQASIGSDTRLLYGARVHESTSIGDRCVIAGNCPDRTTIMDDVIHLGKISHSFYHPFAEWDEPAEPGPTIESHVVIGTDAHIIGPVHIGRNSFILPREIVRIHVPADSLFRNGKILHMPHWADYLRALGKAQWSC